MAKPKAPVAGSLKNRSWTWLDPGSTKAQTHYISSCPAQTLVVPRARCIFKKRATRKRDSFFYFFLLWFFFDTHFFTFSLLFFSFLFFSCLGFIELWGSQKPSGGEWVFETVVEGQLFLRLQHVDLKKKQVAQAQCSYSTLARAGKSFLQISTEVWLGLETMLPLHAGWLTSVIGSNCFITLLSA